MKPSFGVLLCALLFVALSAVTVSSAQAIDNVIKVTELFDNTFENDGWNRAHEVARAKIELELVESGYNVSFRPYPNVTSDLEAYQILSKEARDGCRLFIIHNVIVRNATQTIAREYPDTKFITTPSVGVIAGRTNDTHMVYYRMWYGTYLAGMGCGRMTKTNKVGVITIPFARGQVAMVNAFALGVRRVNPAAEVYVIQTGAVASDVQEARAADILVDDYGIDCGMAGGALVAPHQKWAKRGINSVGLWLINRLRFGNQVLFEITVDWSSLYRTPLFGYANGSWPGGQEVWGGVEDTVGIASFSPVLPPPVVRELQNTFRALLNGEERIFCGEIMRPLYPQYANDCVPDLASRTMNRWLPGIVINPRNLTLNDSRVLIYMQISHPLAPVLMTIAAIGIVFMIALLCFVVVYRHSAAIHKMSPEFLLVVVFGCSLMLSAVFFQFGEPTHVSCQMMLWIFAIGFALAYTAVFVKNWRIYMLFRNPTLNVFAIHNWQLFLLGAVPMAPIIITLAAWAGSGDPYTAQILKLGSYLDIDEFDLKCGSNSSAGAAVLISLELCIVLATVIIARLINTISKKENIVKQYAESRQLTDSCIVTLMFGSVMMVAYFFASYSPINTVVIYSVAILAVPMGLSFYLFRPLIAHWYHGTLDAKSTSGSGGSGTRTSTTRRGTVHSRGNDSPKHDTAGTNGNSSIHDPL